MLARAARALLLAVVATGPVWAHQVPATAGVSDALAARLAELFGRPVQVGAFSDAPPSAPVRAGGSLRGYVLFTDEVTDVVGYSGKPFRVMVALDRRGGVVGVSMVRHQEPILGAGVSEAQLSAFIDQYRDLPPGTRTRVGGGPRPGYLVLDGLSGATITAMALDAAIMTAVERVVQARGLDAGSARAGRGERMKPWRRAWREDWPQVAVLAAALALLTLVLVVQEWIVRYPRLLAWGRYAFLVFTVVFIGWYALAQLSVINVFTFFQAATGTFRWDIFLADPLLFVLWSFVAVSMLLWGRGVFCGWLCPYGAMQELVNRLGRRLRLPRVELPAVVHERLWALKYVIFLVLFGLSLESLEAVRTFSEVEPFRTAVTLGFDRRWPFVVYAAGFLVISAFNAKFYCKYLCPLGAALAIPARLSLMDWLKRRRECGHPCQICAVECSVRAIRETGSINVNECHYCLDCQVIYHDVHRCPPLVKRRRLRERGRAFLASAGDEHAKAGNLTTVKESSAGREEQ